MKANIKYLDLLGGCDMSTRGCAVDWKALAGAWRSIRVTFRNSFSSLSFCLLNSTARFPIVDVLDEGIDVMERRDFLHGGKV